MAYKIYLSTNDESQYLIAVQRALYDINESVISSPNHQNHENAQQLIRQSDIFLGLYGTDYGTVPTGETASYTELDYQFAIANEKPVLLFMMEGANKSEDERQKSFLEHLMQQHVLTKFRDEIDLEAKVKIAIDNYNRTKKLRRLLPPEPKFRDKSTRPQAPARREEKTAADLSDEELESLVSRSLGMAQDDIEQIVRRALEIHSASQQQEQAKVVQDHDNRITVSPLWGEPIRRSQFNSDIFMIMPFREQYNAIYTNIIQPVSAELNLTIKRGDEFSSTRGSIMQEVWAALNACRLVLVETTEINANVYYELGIAHTLGKPAILLTQTREVEKLPFDLRHLRFVVYDDHEAGHADFEQRLRQSIIWLLNDLEEGE